jgi:hypothetical protein
MLSILLLVGVASLAAQSSQPPGHLETPGATAISGTVVSINSNALIIRTDSGQTRTFLIDNATVGVKEYPVDTRVKVDFILDDQNRGVAKVIMGGAAGSTAPVEASTASSPAAEVETRTESALTPTESEPAANLAPVTDQESGNILPETASNLPLVGLLGLLALAASLVVSRFS